ncbi:MAG: hypothetical protein U0Q11_21765 [Vicinamibacterales bacterium]
MKGTRTERSDLQSDHHLDPGTQGEGLLQHTVAAAQRSGSPCSEASPSLHSREEQTPHASAIHCVIAAVDRTP